MPIIRVKTGSNPYSPLAWKTSLAVLALEKLRKGKHPHSNELEALPSVADQLNLFFDASKMDLERISQEPRLRSSFFALRAIKGEHRTSPIPPPVFERAGKEIQTIYNEYKECKTPETLDQKMLRDAQDLCLKLLEHLNKQRPKPSLR
jgi:hypothetical protein